MRRYLAVIALLFAHGLAAAGGYLDWQFGMTQAQVRAVGDPGRYYAFKNGDLGAGSVPFEGGEALLSFYFTDGQMVRAMLINYRGSDTGLARQAWQQTYTHMARVCGDVESLVAGPGASSLAAVLAAFDKEVPVLAPGQRHQIGCLHMPADARVWASITRGPDNQLMAAVNYGKQAPD